MTKIRVVEIMNTPKVAAVDNKGDLVSSRKLEL